MHMARLPIGTWLVVDRSRNGNVVSTHPTPDDAERQRDKLNGGRAGGPFAACMAIEPVAQGMSRPCR